MITLRNIEIRWEDVEKSQILYLKHIYRVLNDSSPSVKKILLSKKCQNYILTGVRIRKQIR